MKLIQTESDESAATPHFKLMQSNRDTLQSMTLDQLVELHLEIQLEITRRRLQVTPQVVVMYKLRSLEVIRDELERYGHVNWIKEIENERVLAEFADSRDANDAIRGLRGRLLVETYDPKSN
jgi:hypothetical protein